jgi:hypothetical protein
VARRRTEEIEQKTLGAGLSNRAEDRILAGKRTENPRPGEIC